MIKTNAIRIIEATGRQFQVYEYDFSDGKIDGMSVALKIGKKPDQVFKTLVAVGKVTGFNVYVIPVTCELDLKKAAHAANDKYIEMIKLRDLEPLTGYVHGGCSPIGMKKLFPTFIEETAEIYDTIVISAGRVGVQLEIPPQELLEMIGANFYDLV